jgi:drug/metabolite transporter (DMT)-like permease
MLNIKPTKPILVFLLVIAIIIIGFSAILIKLSLAPGNVTAFYRLFIGSVIVFIPFLFNIRKPESRPSGRAVWISIAGGVIFGIDMVLWTTGVDLGGATMPTLVANTAPVWVGIGAMIFFKEKLRTGFWLGLAVALAGVFLVMSDTSGKPMSFNAGTILGLSAAVFYGSFFLISQQARKYINTLQYFWISSFSASMVNLLFIFILGQQLFGYPFVSWVYFFIMGFIGQVVGWLILNYLQGKLPASLIAPTLLVQPVMTALLAMFFLGDSFTLLDIIGGTIVLSGIFIVHWTRKK